MTQITWKPETWTPHCAVLKHGICSASCSTGKHLSPCPPRLLFPICRHKADLCFVLYNKIMFSDFVYWRCLKENFFHSSNCKACERTEPETAFESRFTITITAAFVMRHSAALRCESLWGRGCFLCHTQSQNNMRWMAKRLAWKQDGYVQSLFVKQKWNFLGILLYNAYRYVNYN